MSQKNKRKQDDDDKYVVVTKTYPTSYGCYQGKVWEAADLICNTEVEVSEKSYDSYEKAVKAARKIRDSHCEFDDGEWDDDELPWDSADLGNYDNDEEKIITVMTKGEYEKEKEEDRLYVEGENLRMEFQYKVDAGMRAEQAKAGGGVFYANPHRPSNSDVPAELEINEMINVKDIDKDLASIKSLCFRGGKDRKWIASIDYWDCGNKKKKDKAPEDVLLAILPHCTSLQELHLHQRDARASLSSGYISRMLQVAPHLAATLKVLSLPFINIDPDGVASLVKFKSLEHLDLWYCLSVEHYNFDRDYDHDDLNDYLDEELPYDAAFEEFVDSHDHLTRVDFGNGDADEKRAIHDYALSRKTLEVLSDELDDRKGKVTFTNSRNPPQGFGDETAKAAARKRVLSNLAKDDDEKEAIRVLANEKLKSL